MSSYSYCRVGKKFYASWDSLPPAIPREKIEFVTSEFDQLPKRIQDRLNRFAPNNIPKKIRVYDNGGESGDRYTCCFKGLRPYTGWYQYLAMSESPFSPCGIGLHCEHNSPIDYPRYSHLGKRVKFEDLPKDVQICIWQDYCDYWGIPRPVEYIKPSITIQGG